MDMKSKIEKTGKEIPEGAKKVFITDRTATIATILGTTSGIILGVMVMHKLLGNAPSITGQIPGIPVPTDSGSMV